MNTATLATVPPAIAYNVRELDDAEGTEVLAGSPEEAVTTLYGDRVFRLLRDCFASEPDWTVFVVTLRTALQVVIIVSSGEARP